jgi:K+-transporting ATPase ATPase C chain
MRKLLLQSLLMLVALSLIAGVCYPLLVTGVARLCCARAAEGSLLYRNGRLIGSRLLGQPFDQPRYFWSRPSATASAPYNGLASGGSNLGSTNAAQLDAVNAQVKRLQEADPGNANPIPVDLVTASASGLDPQVSPAAAEYQVARVARERRLDPALVRALIARHTDLRQWGILGEPRINVLELNLALDALH